MTSSPATRYPAAAGAHQRRRLWAACVIAIGFGAIGLASGAPGPMAVAPAGVLIALHAAWQLARAPQSVIESVVVDAIAATYGIAVLAPTSLVLAVLAVILGLQCLLYLPLRQTAWLMAGIGLTFAAAEWWVSGIAPPPPEVVFEVSLVGIAGLLPMLAWLIDIVGSVSRQLELASVALEQSSRRFERLFQQAPLPHFRTTFDGRLLDGNSALLEAFGASSIDELRAEPLSVRYADQPGRDRFLSLLRTNGEVRGLETRMLRLGGESVWCRISAVLVLDEEGNEIIEGVIEDVTALRESNRRAHYGRFLLDQVPAAVIGIGSDGVITFWSTGAEELYGWSSEEAVGRAASDLLVTRGLKDTAAEVAAALVSAGRWEGEIDAERNDGTIVHCAASAKALTEGDLPGGTVLVLRDISDRTAAEAEARRQGELARSVLESVAMPMAVVDSDGLIRAVNRAWDEFALDNGGDTAVSGVGTNYLAVAARAGDETARQALHGVSSVLDGHLKSFSMEYDCHAPDEQRWFRMEATPIPGMGAVVAHWNVTEERLAQVALQDLIRQKDEFIAAVSHELRTPLTTVVGLATELTDREFSAPEMDEFHRLIAEQAQEVAHIVEDLLVAARADTDTLTVLHAPVDVRVAVNAVLDATVDPRAEGIAVVDDGGRGVALADPTRLRQILRNLIINAMRHGASPITVEVRDTADGPSVAVVDRGLGIPKAGEPRLFEPYARFAESEGQPSSVGLGLYVSERLAHLMGGTLEYSRRDGATVFTLSLPAVREQSAVA